MVSIPHDMQTQADNQRNGVQPDALHGVMADLDITTSGSATPTETTVASKATSVTKSGNEIDGYALALNMQQRCRLLLDELEQFQAYLKEEGKEHSAELRALKTEVQSEMKVLDKVSGDASQKSQRLLILVHRLQKSLPIPEVYSPYTPPISRSSRPFGIPRKNVPGFWR